MKYCNVHCTRTLTSLQPFLVHRHLLYTKGLVAHCAHLGCVSIPPHSTLQHPPVHRSRPEPELYRCYLVIRYESPSEPHRAIQTCTIVSFETIFIRFQNQNPRLRIAWLGGKAVSCKPHRAGQILDCAFIFHRTGYEDRDTGLPYSHASPLWLA